jgi:cold shock CspA family protein
MRTLFIAAASALFFAAVITELSMRLWPGQYFALLLLAFVALLLSGLLNLRLAGRPGSSAAAGRHERAEAPRPARQGQPERPPAGDRGARGTRNDKRGNARPETAAPAPSEPPSGLPRETGTVKWFNRTKGFGFVIRASGEEIFVHQRSIRATGEGENRRRPALRDGQSVTFVVAEREKGLQAEDVVPVD